MKTICLYFEIHQIIHLKRYLAQIIIIMMILPTNRVLTKLLNVLTFRL